MNLKPSPVPHPIPTPNNMGIVRYLLALGVIISHFKTLNGADFWFPLSSYTRVGGFFALSGFLIYGSYLRRRHFGRFIEARAIRLMPAYIVTVLLCAIFLVFLSNVGPADYYLSRKFWKYLISNLLTLNFLEPSLPGVFTGNLQPYVNGALWTMKVEWLFFFTIPLVAWFVRRFKANPTLVFVGIYIFAVIYRIAFHELYISTGKELYNILGRQFLGQFAFFYSGVLIYYWFGVFQRYKVAVIIIDLLLIAASPWIPYYEITLGPIVVSSVALWLSTVGKWGTWEYKKDNVSYNMYLLHYPIIQIAAHFGLPQIAGLPLTFVIVLAVIVLLSIIVNKLVEEPIQRWWRRHAPFRNAGKKMQEDGYSV